MKAKLDQVFSWYMRLRFADDDGNCECFTCGKVEPWTKIQNGHFISRARHAVRWRPDNCRPQCYGCNIRRSGEQWLFGRKLDQHYGAGHAEKMYRLSRRKYEPTKDEYELHIEYYEAKVASMLARRIERNNAERERVPERMRARMRDVKN